MTKIIQQILLPLCLVSFILTHVRSQGITLPRTPSPAATVSQTIGISTVTVNYSRPSVKDRKIWGDLVPYGWNKQAFGLGKDAPWRAGANENTTIEFSHDVKVGGQAVPAGKYGLFFTINPDNTGEAILSKENRNWGSFFYDPAYDQLRTKIQLRDIAPTELLTYDFINLNKNGGELVLNWEKKQFPLSIEFAVDEIVMANAAAELKGPIGFNWQGPYSAANYALQNKVHTEEAIGWSQKALGQNKNFNTLNLQAALLRQAGRTAEADKIQQGAVAQANEAELNQYGYQLLGENKFEEAVKMMSLNAERHPESANAWDSLGEAYALKGDKTNAIANFKKALSKKPSDAVRANSEKYLKQLGGM